MIALGWLRVIPTVGVAAAVLFVVATTALRYRARQEVPNLPEVIALKELPSDSTEDRIQLIIEGDLFRLDREPSSAAFLDPAADAVSSPPPAKLHRQWPRLRVTGILGGPPWEAVVEGLPGRSNGIVIRTGESYDGARILRVTRDSVIVSIDDSTYRLATVP